MTERDLDLLRAKHDTLKRKRKRATTAYRKTQRDAGLALELWGVPFTDSMSHELRKHVTATRAARDHYTDCWNAEQTAFTRWWDAWITLHGQKDAA